MQHNEILFHTIKQMPCLFAVKDLKHHYSYMSDLAAHIAGFENAEAANGISDYDFKCDISALVIILTKLCLLLIRD